MGNALGTIAGGVGGFLLGGPQGAAMGAQLGSSLDASLAASSASSAQVDAANRASDVSNAQYQQTRADQLSQYEQVRSDQQPWREAGTAAIGRLSAGSSPGGAYTKNFSMADYQADPGYQFRLQQGEQGIQRAASARGGQYSGATLKALANFNSGLASQEYGNAYSRFNTDQTTRFNRDSSIAGIGQTANTAVGNAGTNATNAIGTAGMQNAFNTGQNIQNAGEARASGYVGSTNAIGSGVKQLYNAYQQSNALGSLGSLYSPSVKMGDAGFGDYTTLR